MHDNEGKVALITGAGRGQGRAHAARLARSGADVIAIDVCCDIPAFPYPMATEDDLAETVRLVESEGRRCVKCVADVSSLPQLERAYRFGLNTLGAASVDIVIANAGGIGYPSGMDDGKAFAAQLDVILIGTWNTLQATVPDMKAANKGGAIVMTSSTSALKGFVGGSGGLDGYTAAKAGLVGLMKAYANQLAPYSIRVNTIHPTGVNTGMVANEAFMKWATAAAGADPSRLANPMPLELLEPEDVAGAVAWLVSDDAKWVTGVALPIDAGFTNK